MPRLGLHKHSCHFIQKLEEVQARPMSMGLTLQSCSPRKADGDILTCSIRPAHQAWNMNTMTCSFRGWWRPGAHVDKRSLPTKAVVGVGQIPAITGLLKLLINWACTRIQPRHSCIDRESCVFKPSHARFRWYPAYLSVALAILTFRACTRRLQRGRGIGSEGTTQRCLESPGDS